MNLRIGTAGYAYPAWVGGFYPPGTPAADHLGFYARHFPAVEINSSFYRPPTPEQVAKMARRTPPGFGFTLKVPKSASHGRDAGELPAFKLAADQLAAHGKLLGLILQEPESFHHTPANRDWLARVGEALRPHRVAVEFRHRSWAASNLEAWMGHVGLDLVSVGVPDIDSLFPRGLRVANRRVYARLHSQDASVWYAGGAARYDYDYPPAAVAEWADGLKRIAAEGRADDGLFFFNNCVGTQAVENARALAAALRGAPGINLVEAPEPEARQPSLFE